MSVFDQNNTQQNYLDNLVGETQKYKSAEDLAKAYANADEHISKLTAELNELREKNNSSTNIEKALDNINKPNDNAQVNATQGVESLSREDLLNLVKGELNRDKEFNAQQANIDQVDNFLKNLYGDKAIEMASKKASELNISVEEMKSLSAKSPAAVMTFFNAGNKEVYTNTLKETVNTLTQTEAVKGGSYYNKLRKENPKAYYSKEVRAEMQAAIKKLGNDFLSL